MQEMPRDIETFLNRIKQVTNPNLKLSLFRLSCLLISHKLSLMA